MTRRRSRLRTVFLASVLVLPGWCVFAQSGHGGYRAHGHYRAPSPPVATPISPTSTPWQPSYYHQNKYYQVEPSPLVSGSSRFSGSPYPSIFTFGGVAAPYSTVEPYAVGRPHPRPVYGGQVVYSPEPRPSEPIYVETTVAPPPQVIIVQQPAAPAPQARPSAPPPVAPSRATRSDEPGRVRLNVTPRDAVVRLDRHLLGDGDQIEALGGALELPPGVYVLEAEHTSLPSQRLVFGVSPGQSMRVTIDLSQDLVGARAQVDLGEEAWLGRWAASDDGQGMEN